VRLRDGVERRRGDRLVPVLFAVHAVVAIVLIAMLTAGTLLAGNRQGAADTMRGTTGGTGGGNATTVTGQPSGQPTRSAGKSVKDQDGGSDATASSAAPGHHPSPVASASVTAPVGVATPVTQQATTSCLHVTHQLNTQWSGGFQVQFAVENCASASITGWMVAVTFTDRVDLQAWNAQPDNGSPTVRFSPLPFNTTIAAGKTVTFGFNASWTSGDPRAITGCAVASGSCS
jgi:hypothetical protein